MGQIRVGGGAERACHVVDPGKREMDDSDTGDFSLNGEYLVTSKLTQHQESNRG